MRQFISKAAAQHNDEGWIEAMSRKHEPQKERIERRQSTPLFLKVTAVVTLVMLWSIYQQVRMTSLRLELMDNGGSTENLRVRPGDTASPRGPSIQK